MYSEFFLIVVSQIGGSSSSILNQYNPRMVEVDDTAGCLINCRIVWVEICICHVLSSDNNNTNCIDEYYERSWFGIVLRPFISTMVQLELETVIHSYQGMGF